MNLNDIHFLRLVWGNSSRDFPDSPILGIRWRMFVCKWIEQKFTSGSSVISYRGLNKLRFGIYWPPKGEVMNLMWYLLTWGLRNMQQAEIFDNFLHGETLEECYAAVAAVADRWLDLLEVCPLSCSWQWNLFWVYRGRCICEICVFSFTNS